MAVILTYAGVRSASWEGAFETVCRMDAATEPPWMGLRRVSKAPSQDAGRATKLRPDKTHSNHHSFFKINRKEYYDDSAPGTNPGRPPHSAPAIQATVPPPDP